MIPKVTIGMISFNDKKYLEYNLPALLAQDYGNFEVVVCNNQPGNGISEWIEEKFPQVKVVSAGGNVGFGKAHNMMISSSDTDFYLCFNSDMTAPVDYVSKLVESVNRDEKIGCVTGKLVSWTNFPSDPKNIVNPVIDTVGLQVLKNSQVVDMGQGKKACCGNCKNGGNCKMDKEVFGASGASPLYRILALKDIAHSPGEFFDNEFFMYKEDVDLAFRLRWAGWKTIYCPKAMAWHDRTAKDIRGFFAKIKERRDRPRYIKENSFLNQLLLTKKNWSSQFSIATKFRIWLFLAKYFLFLLLFDTKTLSVLAKCRKLRSKMREKAKTMPRRISAREMGNWFGRV